MTRFVLLWTMKVSRIRAISHCLSPCITDQWNANYPSCVSIRVIRYHTEWMCNLIPNSMRKWQYAGRKYADLLLAFSCDVFGKSSLQSYRLPGFDKFFFSKTFKCFVLILLSFCQRMFEHWLLQFLFQSYIQFRKEILFYFVYNISPFGSSL